MRIKDSPEAPEHEALARPFEAVHEAAIPGAALRANLLEAFGGGGGIGRAGDQAGGLADLDVALAVDPFLQFDAGFDGGGFAGGFRRFADGEECEVNFGFWIVEEKRAGVGMLNDPPRGDLEVEESCIVSMPCPSHEGVPPPN